MAAMADPAHATTQGEVDQFVHRLIVARQLLPGAADDETTVPRGHIETLLELAASALWKIDATPNPMHPASQAILGLLVPRLTVARQLLSDEDDDENTYTPGQFTMLWKLCEASIGCLRDQVLRRDAHRLTGTGFPQGPTYQQMVMYLASGNWSAASTDQHKVAVTYVTDLLWRPIRDAMYSMAPAGFGDAPPVSSVEGESSPVGMIRLFPGGPLEAQAAVYAEQLQLEQARGVQLRSEGKLWLPAGD